MLRMDNKTPKEDRIAKIHDVMNEVGWSLSACDVLLKTQHLQPGVSMTTNTYSVFPIRYSERLFINLWTSSLRIT